MPDDKSNRNPSCGPMPEDEIDETLEETFPASDPPSWTMGVDPHCQNNEGDADKRDDKASED